MPIADYQVEGTSQPITHLFPDSSGSMWFVQQLSETGNDTISQFRLGRIDDAGNITTFPAQVGRALYTQAAPDGVGGAWVLGAETWTSQSQSYGDLTHMNASGTIAHVPMPNGLLPDSIKLGTDGNAWLLGCSGVPNSGEQPCSAYSVSPVGKVNSYPLTSIDYEMPTHAYYAQDTMMPATDGMWMNPSHTSPGHVAFVSYSGTATTVPLEAGLEFVGPGPGDDVWWQRTEAASITVGLLSPAGELSAEQTRPANFSAPNAYFTQAGHGGNLLWSDSTPWDENQTGQIGTYTASGKTEYVVPKWAVAVPHGESFWTGACTFGTQLHEASGGGLWIVSAGHPDMISYESPAGAFSTFMPVPPPAPMELGIDAMQESTTGGLWFALYTESGQTLLARADSLSPPPGLPPYPGMGSTTSAPETTQGTTTTPGGTRAILARALATARISIAELWGRHHTGHIKVSFPVAGSVQVAASIHASGHRLVVATGRLTRTSPGQGTIVIRPTQVGKTLLRQHTHHHVELLMIFTGSSGTVAREARSLKP
jgi:streptogramin lyase